MNPRQNAQSVIDQLHGWFDHYDEVHPHRALRYRSHASSSRKPASSVRPLGGNNTKRIPYAHTPQTGRARVSEKRWLEAVFAEGVGSLEKTHSAATPLQSE